MQNYISNLLPRLKSFSESLDKKELFVDKPWVIIDDKGNKEQFIFKRNGRLLVSMNGVGQEGNWEYERAANGLWIKLHGKNFMLKQGFVDPSVMILKLDGPSDNLWCFGNENTLGNTPIVDYLKRLYRSHYEIKTIILARGTELEVFGGATNSHLPGRDVKIENSVPKNGLYTDEKGNKYRIDNGKILEVKHRKTYTVESWPIEFYCKSDYELTVGDEIITNRSFKESFLYKVSETGQRIKFNGNTVSKAESSNQTFWGGFVVAIFLLILLIVYIIDKKA